MTLFVSDSESKIKNSLLGENKNSKTKTIFGCFDFCTFKLKLPYNIRVNIPYITNNQELATLSNQLDVILGTSDLTTN